MMSIIQRYLMGSLGFNENLEKLENVTRGSSMARLMQLILIILS